MHEIKNRTVKFKDGSKFVVKSLNGKEFDSLMNQIIISRPDGSTSVDLKKQNEFFLRNCVVEAPYELEGKLWKELSSEERLKVLNENVNLNVRSFLLKAIREDNIGGEELKK